MRSTRRCLLWGRFFGDRIHFLPDFLQHPVGHRGVLADVEAHGAEAEYLRLPAHGAHKCGGNAHGFHINQRPLRGGKFGDELGHIAKRRCPRHLLQAKPQGTEELAEWFLRIALPYAFALPAGVQLLRQTCGEFSGKTHFVVTERNELDQFRQTFLQPLNRGFAVLRQGIARGGDGHKGIAVAVAANPRGKFQAAGAPGLAVPDSGAAGRIP